MVNLQKYYIGEQKNFGELPIWEINHEFRLIDASSRPGVNFANRDVNIETTYKTLNQDYLYSAKNSHSQA